MNDTLIARARQVVPGAANSAQRRGPGLEDMVVTATSGATFTDASGRTYLDFHGSYGPPLLGHNDPDVDRAVAKAASSLDIPGVGITPPEIELAELLVELIPSIERVLLTATGSEATYQALRLARVATGRRRIVKFEGCYHGWYDAVAISVTPPEDRLGRPHPLSADISQAVLDETVVAPFNDLGSVEAAFNRHAGEIAAVIVEPVVHNVGCLLPVEGFLEGLRELCTGTGAVLIFDEVAAGFRHGLGGYQAIAGVLPDLTTVGKTMANGYPIAAVGGRADLMDLFSTRGDERPAFFAGTYNGHPAMAAAAVATLRKYQREPVHETVYRLGERARTGLAEVLTGLDVPAVVAGLGSVFVSYFLEPPVESYTDLLRNDEELFTGYRREQMADGVFELPLNLKRSQCSYAHTEADVDRLLETTGRALAKCRARASSAE